MEKGVIEVDPRHTARRIRMAMQGNPMRALVELITNSDDSYIRLEENGMQVEDVIDIIYRKEGYCGYFAVRDRAEGMSLDDIRNSFKKYGAATSGMNTGKGVRGYFGQGAKDALAGMEDGRIRSIKDGFFVECRLFFEDGKATYEIQDPVPASEQIRKSYGIKGNGTYASFRIDPAKNMRVPQLNTIYQDLSNNCLLRKIMGNTKRSIWLADENVGDKKRLRYITPTPAREILRDDFSISYGEFPPFPVQMVVSRSENYELTQTGDDRDGGLLVTDDKDAVLDMSLFKYENEPLASRFFGQVRIQSFRLLLDKEEAVLSDERNGLIRRHSFCQALIREIEKRLDVLVGKEKMRRQKEAQSRVDAEESTRYRKAFSILNDIAEKEALPAVNLGDDPTNQKLPPPNGFCLYPSSAQITVGKRYNFSLRIDKQVIRRVSVVKLTCSNSKIGLLTSEISLYPDGQTGVLTKHVSLEGQEPNIEGTLRAVLRDLSSESAVQVLPEKELLLSEGMVFQPKSLTLRPSQIRKVYLMVYVKMVETSTKISITTDNDLVHVSKTEIVVNEVDAVRHIAKYELEVWGEGTGQQAVITADSGSYIALLGVRLRSREEDLKQDDRKGLFDQPEFDTATADPLQRASYSAETGRVIIYVNFPSTLHYLGNERQHAKTLPAQVLIADLVAERCFYEIARRKVDARALLNPEARAEAVQKEAYDFSRKFGKKVHEVLVDQNLLKQAKSPINNAVAPR